MSLWTYQTSAPPPLAYDVPDRMKALLVASGSFGSGVYLTSTNQIYTDDEPVDKPLDGRWIRLTRFEPMAGQRTTGIGELLVTVHAMVAGPRLMAGYRAWHREMHRRIDAALTGQALTGLSQATADLISRETEPSSPRFYGDTDTRESFCLYAVRLVAKAA